MLPAFLAATIWRWMYAPNFGLANVVLGWFGVPSINFLNDTGMMLYALIAVDVWVSAGFNMVILLAGLKNIPQDLYEAARLDGAGRFQQVRYITIPMLAPVLFFVIDLRLHLRLAGVRRAVAADRIVLHRLWRPPQHPAVPGHGHDGPGLWFASGSGRPRPMASS